MRLRMFVVVESQVPKRQTALGTWLMSSTTCRLFCWRRSTEPSANELPKRWVLVGSSAYCLMMTAVWMFANELIADDWTLCIGLSLVMAGSAVFSPVRYALLPAAAHDTHLPLLRVNALIEMGASMTAVAGLILTMTLYIPGWAGWPRFRDPGYFVHRKRNCVFFAFSCLVASDVRRTRIIWAGCGGFFP